MQWRRIDDAPNEVLAFEITLTVEQKKQRPVIDYIGRYGGKLIIVARNDINRVARWWMALEPLPLDAIVGGARVIYDESGFSSGVGIVEDKDW
jgi:hypothetical protein